MRTTLDIDDPILADLKRLQNAQGKTLGRLVSDLLAEALGRRGAGHRKRAPLRWNTSPGSLLIDPLDKEAIYALFDEESRGRRLSAAQLPPAYGRKGSRR